MFAYESCELLVGWMWEKWNIAVDIKPRGNRKDGVMKYRLYVLPEDNNQFVSLIEPYVLPMFQYKLKRIRK
tara:strand:- start:335 stop:547 length:213 start_codon:yes stop_codon:yes gene_type:complete